MSAAYESNGSYPQIAIVTWQTSVFCRYAKASSLTKELAQRKARLNSEGYEAWTKARAAKDFSMFAPKLKEIVELTREIAAVTSPDKPLYDAALDNFEKGMTAERIDEVRLQPPWLQYLSLNIKGVRMVIHNMQMQRTSSCDGPRFLDPGWSEFAAVTGPCPCVQRPIMQIMQRLSSTMQSP